MHKCSEILPDIHMLAISGALPLQINGLVQERRDSIANALE